MKRSYKQGGRTVEYETVIRFAITNIGKDGLRTLTFPNQGRYHFDTREAAQASLEQFREGLHRVLGAAVSTLEVRSVECYPHGDACGIYFDEEGTESNR